VELNQTQQPSFHKNFELLIQDLEENKVKVLTPGFHFQVKNKKKD
jgi:transcription-repair coupling factor (superfamily II helicase)